MTVTPYESFSAELMQSLEGGRGSLDALFAKQAFSDIAVQDALEITRDLPVGSLYDDNTHNMPHRRFISDAYAVTHHSQIEPVTLRFDNFDYAIPSGRRDKLFRQRTIAAVIKSADRPDTSGGFSALICIVLGRSSEHLWMGDGYEFERALLGLGTFGGNLKEIFRFNHPGHNSHPELLEISRRLSFRVMGSLAYHLSEVVGRDDLLTLKPGPNGGVEFLGEDFSGVHGSEPAD